MATSFNWKSKHSRVIKRSSSAASKAFSDEAQIDPSEVNDDVDWLHNVPVKRQRLHLEDSIAKANRLNMEGITLAEHERYWEAIQKWNESLQLVSDNSKTLEMKAQALTSLGELFPAVQAARHAVACNPTWWVSMQTLGRALLNMGEIRASIISFQKAIHLHPDCSELWEDDLNWARKLLKELLEKHQGMSRDDLGFYVRECMRVGIT